MKINDVNKFNLDSKEIQYYLDKISNNESIVVITGEFSSGKTYFLNAYLGKENFLEHSNKECTPVLIDIMDNSEEQMSITYKDGMTSRVEASEENVEKYTKYTIQYDVNILSVSIPVKSKYLTKNTHIIDSPGTNTIVKGHEEITNYILRKSDIVLYVINKVISKSDLKYIKEIYKYTEEIIFIITHIDEVDEEQRKEGIFYKPQKDIERYINSAKEEIEKEIGIEDPEIFPVGSKEAIRDDRYIEKIRECVKNYIDVNSKQVIKSRVKKQLAILFENKLKEIEKENEFFISNISTDKDEIERKITAFNENVFNVEKKNQSRLKNIDVNIMKEKTLLNNEIKTLFDLEKSRILEKLLNNKNITQEKIEDEFENTWILIGQGIKLKLETKIQEMLNNVYGDIDSEIKELMGSMNIKMETTIKPPMIEDIDDNYYEKDKQKFINKQEKNNQKINEIISEIECNEDEKNEIKERMKEANETIELHKKYRNELGGYVPQYEEIRVNGGGESGRKLGRMIGEVIDLGLLITPVGAATTASKGSKLLRGADKVKDVFKGMSYLQKGTKTQKSISSAVKMKNAAEKVKKAAKVTGETKNKIVKVGQEVAQKTGKLDQIGKALDVLSIGYWGEKAGDLIGETIKPTQIIIKENQEQKNQWLQQKNAIQQELDTALSIKRQIEEEYKNADTVKQKLKLKREIERKNERYEEMLEELEEISIMKKEKAIDIKIEDYYNKELENIFTREMATAQNTAMMVLGSAKEKIVNKSEVDLKEKIEEIENKIEKLADKKGKIENEIDKNQENINELSKYNEWIDKWVDECENI